MRSRVTVLGHPVHVMLVAFPIALYAITFATLIAFAATRDPFWWRAATLANGSALVAALVAAIPGAIDLVSIVRTRSARRTGRVHAGANLLALAAFAACYAVLATRGAAWLPGAIALAGLGIAAVLLAGFHGWSLVQDHHIGVRRGGEPSSARSRAAVGTSPPPASMVATDHSQRFPAEDPRDERWAVEPTLPWNPAEPEPPSGAPHAPR